MMKEIMDLKSPTMKIHQMIQRIRISHRLDSNQFKWAKFKSSSRLYEKYSYLRDK